MDINYLSLKLSQNYWEIQTNSQATKHKCYFPKENGRYMHQLHTENAQLNTIIDLQISQAESLREFNHVCTELWKTVHTEMLTKNILLRNIHENQEYIKNQYTYLITMVKEIERSLLLQKQLTAELKEILDNLQRQSKIFDYQTTKTAALLEKLQKNSEEW